MAYWNINFRSIDNTVYRISVGGKSGNVDSTLYGASKPFSVDEDDDDDVFRTVRLQTGYIRILDIGVDVEEAPFDWHDLIPSNATSRPVTLYKGNNVIWRGFLRPETYGGEYLMERQERAFPIFGQLSALEAFDCDLNAAEFMNFGGLLYHIFSQERGLWTKFYFQGTDATSTWLFKKFYTSLYVDEDR